MKPRLVPGDENSFLAQFSALARGSCTTLFLGGHSDVECLRSATKIKQFEGKKMSNVCKLNQTVKATGTDTFDLWELRSDPHKRRLPPPLFGDMDFLDELEASQHISYVIQPAHFGCTRKQTSVSPLEW